MGMADGSGLGMCEAVVMGFAVKGLLVKWFWGTVRVGWMDFGLD